MFLHTSQLEKSRAEFLLIHGGNDECVYPGVLPDATARLKNHGKDNFRVLLYPGAGHLLEPPYSPLFKATYIAAFGK